MRATTCPLIASPKITNAPGNPTLETSLCSHSHRSEMITKKFSDHLPSHQRTTERPHSLWTIMYTPNIVLIHPLAESRKNSTTHLTAWKRRKKSDHAQPMCSTSWKPSTWRSLTKTLYTKAALTLESLVQTPGTVNCYQSHIIVIRS